MVIHISPEFYEAMKLRFSRPPRGRVWLGGDGLYYWSCQPCMENILRAGVNRWIDYGEPGGRAYTINDGCDYVTGHIRSKHHGQL